MNNSLHKLLAVLTALTLLTGCCVVLAEEAETTADTPENHTQIRVKLKQKHMRKR